MEDNSQKGGSALTCFKCREEGHKKADCWRGKARQSPWERGKGGSNGSNGKEKEDKAKESAAGVREVDATWMVMLDELDFEASDKDFPAHCSMSSLKGY